MHQRGSYLSSPTLKRSQEPGDDFVKERGQKRIKLRVESSPLLSDLQNVAQAISKERFPTIAPGVILRKVTVICGAVESEFAFR
ncbi:hypothetical protein Trco_001512 [Trichoderma cornu-damae]|uniref:Uncharacterized protein n=1 Tax=Trichoderma cornu-damae TaxID=654480 RepID=A0A9P8QZ10_9HYPO|nr:hypothetical protein Trco_001512 [Trichoderma cornu-damae]